MAHGSKHISRREFLQLAGAGAVSAVAASALTSCKATPAATPASAPTQKPAEELVTLRYQNHWTREGDAHYTSMQWLYKTFQEKNPNTKLNIVVIPDSDESTRKMQTDCAAGDCPDVIHEVYMDYYDSGWLVDLAPYIDAEWKSRLIPEVLDELTWDGHTYGISMEYSPMPCIWNMRCLDKVGEGIPKTWDEFLALGEALKSKGLILTSFPQGMYLHGFTALVFSRPGAEEAMAKEQWDCEQVLYAFQRLKELVDNGYIPGNDAELKWRQVAPLFQTDKLAMFPNGAWHIRNTITAEGADPELQKHVAFSPFPSTGNGRVIQLMNATAMGLGSQLLKQPERLEAAIKFLKYWTSDESAQVFITEAQSPLGVKADIPADKVPLLAAFMGAVKEADRTFALPKSKKLRARAWDHPDVATQAILAGKSAEEATAIYAAELRK